MHTCFIHVRRHPLAVIFFENTELRWLTERLVGTTEDLYGRSMAETFVYEKQERVYQLRRCGIYTILTPLDERSMQTVNKCLEP